MTRPLPTGFGGSVCWSRPVTLAVSPWLNELLGPCEVFSNLHGALMQNGHSSLEDQPYQPAVKSTDINSQQLFSLNCTGCAINYSVVQFYN